MDEQRIFLPRLEVEHDRPGALLVLSSRRWAGPLGRLVRVFLTVPVALLGALFAAGRWCLAWLARTFPKRVSSGESGRVWLSPRQLTFCASTGRLNARCARWWRPWDRLFSWPLSSLENVRIESRLSLWQDASITLLFDSRGVDGRVSSWGFVFSVRCADTREKVLDLAFRIAQIAGLPWYHLKQERLSFFSLALASPAPGGDHPFRPRGAAEGFLPVPWKQEPACYHEDRLDLSTLPPIGGRPGLWTYWVFLAAVFPCVLGFSYWQTNQPGPQCRRFFQAIENFCSESGLSREAALFCQSMEATLPKLRERSLPQMERRCAESNLVLPRALQHMQ